MNIFYKLFFILMNSFGRYRLICDRQTNKPYLERYYIFLKERNNFPFNIFLHNFLSSDPDDLHDHPWDFRTLILCGGYWEHTEEGKFWRGPLSFRYMPCSIFHRIELDKNKPFCWTLFIPGKIRKDWGFKTKNGWINNRDYFNNKETLK